MATKNPFRIGGRVSTDWFTDRKTEVARIVDTLQEPQAKLLVYGPRRMGKTSALVVAAARVRAAKGHVLMADLSTASAVADIASRILQAAIRQLGRSWVTSLVELAKHLQVSFSMQPHAASGVPVPALDVSLREATEDVQRTTLAQVLDAIDDLARAKRTTIGIILDEFQEIHRFGAEHAEWHLRGTIQHHEHVSYVLAGSDERQIRAMIGSQRAFYKLFEILRIGAIDPPLMVEWIDTRFANAGIVATGVGAEIVAAAGPRTRDIVELARQCFAHAVSREKTKRAQPLIARDVAHVLAQLARDEDDPWRAIWRSLTNHQQDVLRAVAATGGAHLTSRDTRRRFTLGDSGTVTNTAGALVNRDLLVKTDTGYAFDNPFFREWVVINTLADLGLRPPDVGV